MTAPELPPSSVVDLESWSRLAGHSNSVVLLATRDGAYWFIRKIAGGPASAARLHGQIAKQNAFGASSAAAVVAVPPLLGASEAEPHGGCYYDMEYVRGQSVTSFLSCASYQQVHWLSDRLCEYLQTAWSAPPIRASGDNSFFSGCFRKLVELASNRQLPSDVTERLFLGLAEVDQHQAIAATMCHGDMTFENMLVTHDNRLFAIDFLDAPFEHVWYDVAKLHQDLSGEWYRLEYSPISSGVLAFLRERITRFMIELTPAYERLHFFLLALTFARILPYVKTVAERELVLSRLRRFAEQIAG